MPRLMGVDIPGAKRIDIALRYIHGIGPQCGPISLDWPGDCSRWADLFARILPAIGQFGGLTTTY